MWWGDGALVDVIDWICIAIAWLMTIGAGAVAILGVRLRLPWPRPIASPRMWGIGAIVVGLAATIGITMHGRSYADVATTTCMVVTGLCLMTWAERPEING
ncbi:hypothetical protein GCM10022206_31000 [Streptomyces chiangmaiensis]